MKITLVKVYDGRKEYILGEPAKSFYGIMSIDASIEGIRSLEDFDEIIKHLKGWKEELQKSKMI